MTRIELSEKSKEFQEGYYAFFDLDADSCYTGIQHVEWQKGWDTAFHEVYNKFPSVKD